MANKFVLVRAEDETGVSGTGIIAQGIEWDDKTVTLKWRAELGDGTVYPGGTETSFPGGTRQLMRIHGHEGKTRLRWEGELADGAIYNGSFEVGLNIRRSIVVVCGSTRHMEEMALLRKVLTLDGYMVMGVEVNLRDVETLRGLLHPVSAIPPSEAEIDAIKLELDDLHLDKIRRADAVCICNVGGYIGASTLRELAFAVREGKEVMWLEPGSRLSRAQIPDFDSLDRPTSHLPGR